MPKLWQSLLVVLVFLTGQSLVANAQSHLIELTASEKIFIKEHSAIRVANTPSFQPFDYHDNGVAKGYSIDLLKLLGQRTGLKFEYVTGKTPHELFNQFDLREIDLLHAVNKSAANKSIGIYSEPYKDFDVKFGVRPENKAVSNFQQLNGKTVGFIEDWADFSYLESNFKDLRLVPFQSLEELIRAVHGGHVDALIHDRFATRHAMKRMGVTEIEFTSALDNFVDEEERKLHFYTHNDKPELISILNKGLASLAPGEFDELNREWIGDLQIEKTKNIAFTAEERQYLYDKARIKMCIDPNWMPYEKISDKGEHIGISADFYELFEQRLGIPITLFTTRSWKETLSSVKDRRCDIISMAKRTKERDSYLNFTTPYLNFPLAVAIREDDQLSDDFSEELQKVYAIPRGYAAVENLKREFPGIKVLPVKNKTEGFEKVLGGQADGFIDNWPNLSYALKTKGITGLKIAGSLPSYGGLGVAVRNDDQLLLDIFEKVTQSLTTEERERINNKWLAVDVKEIVDHTLVYQVIIGALILTLMLTFWYFKLRSAKIESEKLVLELVETKSQLEQNNEMLERANKAKTTFLASASHDLRQPLQAISMLVAALELSLKSTQEDQDPRNLMLLGKIDKSVGSLRNLLGALLNISKLDAHVIEPSISTFNIQTLFNELEPTLQITALEKDLEIKFVGSSATLQSDPVLLKQILENLISNSIKYTERGRILIGCRHVADQLRIEIWDTGIGIPEESLNDIFLEFHQLHNPARQSKLGLGLGLSIVQRLSKLIHADINVRSEVGKGTVFSVTVDLHDDRVSHVEETDTDLQSNVQEFFMRQEILVIEDDEAVLESSLILLKSWGYEAYGALDEAEAFEKIRNEDNKPDLIVFDYQLPGKLTGLDLYQDIQLELSRNIPGVIISGSTEPNTLERIKNSGVDFLSKPIDPATLREKIAALLYKQKN